MNESVAIELARDLGALADALEGLASGPGEADPGRSDRREWVIRTLRSYLIPRAVHPTAPLVVVFAGPTGAGKSTLLNSILGAGHSHAGPLRPTTKAPVVVTTPDRVSQYETIDGIDCSVVPRRARILGELTLVDTPDIDSTSRHHRAVAETMIDNADVVVHVNSASRYADLVPWEVLRRAHSRGTSVIHVLNRVSRSAGVAPAEYGRHLEAEGLGPDVLVVHEYHLKRGAQMIPTIAVQGLRDRLADLVRSRQEGRLDTFRSVLRTTMSEAAAMLANAEDGADGRARRVEAVRVDFEVRLDRVADQMADLSLSSVDLSRLAALAGRRLVTKWRVKRRLPSEQAVEWSTALFRSALALGVSNDMRRALSSDEMDLSPSDRATLLRETRGDVTDAINRWLAGIDSLEPVRASLSPGLTGLLMARSSLEVDEGDEVSAALGVVGHRTGITVPHSELRSALATLLAPIYAGLEYRVLARMTQGISSAAEITRVRSTMSTVIARSSFANA
ncbi:MAG: GTPase [Acidimicrobiia bacterium]